MQEPTRGDTDTHLPRTYAFARSPRRWGQTDAPTSTTQYTDRSTEHKEGMATPTTSTKTYNRWRQTNATPSAARGAETTLPCRCSRARPRGTSSFSCFTRSHMRCLFLTRLAHYYAGTATTVSTHFFNSVHDVLYINPNRGVRHWHHQAMSLDSQNTGELEGSTSYAHRRFRCHKAQGRGVMPISSSQTAVCSTGSPSALERILPI